MTLNFSSKKTFAILIGLIMAFFVLPQTALSASRQKLPDYAAEKYSKIDTVEMAPGELKKIKIGFYNRGGYNWRKVNKNYISLYTYGPKYRSSIFYNSNWLKKDQPAKLKDSLVGPNQLGYFEIYLQAPKKAGEYKEIFALAAENKTWVKGGEFSLTITVKNPEASVGNSTGDLVDNPGEVLNSAPAAEPAEKETKLAMRLSKIPQLVMEPGAEESLALLYLNKGETAWQRRALVLNNVSIATADSVSPVFATADWLDSQHILENQSGEIKTGQTEIYNIPLKAPTNPGIYTLHLQLMVDDEAIQGGSLDLPITVTGAGITVPVITEEPLPLPQEPDIAIGLFTTEEPVIFTSSFAYKLIDDQKQTLVVLDPDTQIQLSFNETDQIYTATIGETKIETKSFLNLEPVNTDSYFTLVNYENHPRFNLNLNDNQFRNGLTVRYAETGYLWIINNLALEDYLKGLAEGADSSPAEFLKALATAARSYAYYEIQHPTKHPTGNFTLDAANDQVYRGYNQEKRSPNWVAAVEATLGMVVTYKDEPVFTPYFGRSSGRTLSYKEVWGKNIPWLVSVKTPYDKGYSRWGHGVGLAARDAIYRAKAGANWDDISKYYYRGTGLQKMY